MEKKRKKVYLAFAFCYNGVGYSSALLGVFKTFALATIYLKKESGLELETWKLDNGKSRLAIWTNEVEIEGDIESYKIQEMEVVE